MAATNAPETPRQKMINLMYIILTALLALNVSSDVLNGFSLVEKSISKTTENATIQNNSLYDNLESYYQKNPEKVKEWYDKGIMVRKLSDSLYNYAQDLKVRIVKKADGKKGDVNNIEALDNVDAAGQVMLREVSNNEGKKLYKAINNYRTSILEMVQDSLKRTVIASNLSTERSKKAKAANKNWEESMFENMPVAAAVTILTKLQNDVRYAESEIVHTLVTNIDVSDFRVNQIKAYVIPNSRNVIRGGKYTAQLVLSAEDSTQLPHYYVNNKELAADLKGKYEMICNTTGNFSLTGFIELQHADGTKIMRPFKEDYTVVEPTATISPTLVNVFYAGIENPIEISVPGVPNSQVTATITNGNGTLTRVGNNWSVKPTQIGKECLIAVSASLDGRSQVVATKTFRVRALPTPRPFIVYTDDKGVQQRYKGDRAISKASVLAAPGIIAALDDDFLDVTYRVLSFETTFINAMGDNVFERTEGTKFSEKMMGRFRNLSKGSRFFISRVRAIGPDGVEQSLPPLEVIIN